MSKKILLLLHTPPPFGGGEIQAQNLKEYLRKRETYIIYDYARESLTRKKQGRFNLANIGFGFYWIWHSALLLLKHRPSKIYFTLPKGYFAFLRNGIIILLSRILKVKVLGELPGTSFLFLAHERSFQSRSGAFLLRQVDEIRFLSQTIAAMHERYHLKKSIVIDNGVFVPENLQVNASVFAEPVLPLLYVGSICYSKGIFNSLQAMKICREANLTVHFNIVGLWENDAEKRQAEDFIEENKLTDMITFHGQKLADEKWQLFSRNAVLLHPTYWDGVPLSILEAFGLGLGVISTRVGGIPDIMSDGINGILLEVSDPLKIFNAIAELHRDRERLKCISEANRELFASRFGLERFLLNMRTWFEKED